jgi:hypothetical protein
MAKIPAAVMRVHLQELARLLTSEMTDKEIMTKLGLKRRTYFFRKRKVYAIYGNIAQKKAELLLEGEAHILKDRFLRLYRQLEQNIADSNTPLKHKARAAQVAAELAIQTFKLEVEGYRSRQARQAEAKAVKYV